MWNPDFTALNKCVSEFENGLFYSLMRLQNFTAESTDIEVLPGVRIVHSEHMTNPISVALKGEACWPEARRREYHTKHGANSFETISAYRGAKESKREPFTYECC
ncbi:hypothetical protein ROLI_023690 [Roseobacter fucihabitans]|uniref:Uncharacterized protein n=1 Tax=Roseobacter fucihabitans TaxID=1537242 RepID=A0ABZ2BTG4_9RHOB|nr:hypothetical protein [Roseobacter litoralis]MBC6965781.1 hypothetical protein [Roseobacter litoralis]